MSQNRSVADGVVVPVLLLIASIMSVQVGSAIAKSLFPLIGAPGTAASRLVIAAIILIAIWRPWRARLTKRDAGSIAVYGAALGGMNLLFYLSLQRLPLGIVVAIEFTGPLAVAMFSSRRPIDFLWIALAVTGLLLLLPIRTGVDTLDPLGVVLALGAGLCWALYILFGQKTGNVHGGYSTSLGMMTGALFIAPVGVASAGTSLLQPAILPGIIGVAILSSALPYSLEMVSLKRLPARTFGVLLSLAPALGALSGLVFLGERLHLTQWTAIASIVLASLGSAATARATPTR